ncbi:MAG: hypothetical protein RIT19_1224 [Verrucomicrobiota bacterium]|jgi:hypothetical protein
MSHPTPILPPDGLPSLLEEASRLRRFTGTPAEFWPALVSVMARLAEASRGLLIVGQPAMPDKLRKLSEWSLPGQSDPALVPFMKGAAALAVKALETGRSVEDLGAGMLPDTSHLAIGIRLQFQGGADGCVAVFLLSNSTEARAAEALFRLALLSDIPLDYQAQRQSQQPKAEAERFASVLDVLAQVNSEGRFLAALMALANGVAAQLQCERVGVGWLESGYIRLKVLSRTERFEPRMAAVQALEAAMEEALDQDEEIVWPQPEHSRSVGRDHAAFASAQGVRHLVSLPIRVAGKGVAVMTCERQAAPFSEATLQQLRLVCDQAARRLSDLHASDRWFGSRWNQRLKGRLETWVGPRHTWAKAAAIGGSALLVLLFLPVYPVRIEGNFIVRSEEQSYLSAPFDGFIQSSQVRPGDVLTNGAALMRFNTEQLELEESAAIADQTRYLREAEKARAARNLAEMRIAQAQADQAAARLGMVRHRLAQATLRAPFNGVIVEGDLRQRIAAPVRQGDPLFKFARIDTLYIEAEISERDAHRLPAKASGEIAFVAQPDSKHPIRVVRVEPSAVPKETGNVFIVRASLAGAPQAWWRPGMSGLCKLDAGRGTLFWILTHRTVDFLRLHLWW